MMKILRKLSFYICLIIVIFSFLRIGQEFFKYYKSEIKYHELKIEKEKEYDKTNNTIIDKKNDINTTQEEVDLNGFDDDVIYNETPLSVLSQYKSLYDQNNDLFGWIKIDDTKIDYPVMHTPENINFYLHRDWNKEYSYPGSIFIDGRCTYKSDNIIIYGHNMKNLTMFGNLIYYKNKSYYENHKYITFDTIYEPSKYEIIAVSQAFIKESDLMNSAEDAEKNIAYAELNNNEYLFYNHIDFEDTNSFNEYVDYMKEHSYYDIDSDAKFGDKLITLCTCTNTTKYQNERLLIVAKKIE